jgi:hypothetical protein
MEKVILFGLGNEFRKIKTYLYSNNEVVAVTDNSGIPKENLGIAYIYPEQIPNFEYDKIIICTKLHGLTIKYQLMRQYNIPEEKIDYLFDVQNLKESERKVFESIDKYSKECHDALFPLVSENLWLINHDMFAKATGKLASHYFAQDIWGARMVHKFMPREHYDVGSRVEGFISHLLSFLDHVNYIDIRPLPYEINSLHFIQSDAMNLENIQDEAIESLSSFHALEHFGLGRYGDPIDPDGYRKAIKAFERVLQKGGHLYLGVPIGQENKLIFNAHRIFKPSTVVHLFSDLKLIQFATVRSDNLFWDEVEVSSIKEIEKEIPEYSCGLFEFVKPG